MSNIDCRSKVRYPIYYNLKTTEGRYYHKNFKISCYASKTPKKIKEELKKNLKKILALESDSEDSKEEKLKKIKEKLKKNKLLQLCLLESAEINKKIRLQRIIHHNELLERLKKRNEKRGVKTEDFPLPLSRGQVGPESQPFSGQLAAGGGSRGDERPPTVMDAWGTVKRATTGVQAARHLEHEAELTHDCVEIQDASIFQKLFISSSLICSKTGSSN